MQEVLCTSSEVLRKKYSRHRYILSKVQFQELQNLWPLFTTFLLVKEKSEKGEIMTEGNTSVGPTKFQFTVA